MPSALSQSNPGLRCLLKESKFNVEYNDKEGPEQTEGKRRLFWHTGPFCLLTIVWSCILGHFLSIAKSAFALRSLLLCIDPEYSFTVLFDNLPLATRQTIRKYFNYAFSVKICSKFGGISRHKGTY